LLISGRRFDYCWNKIEGAAGWDTHDAGWDTHEKLTQNQKRLRADEGPQIKEDLEREEEIHTTRREQATACQPLTPPAVSPARRGRSGRGLRRER